MHKCQITGVIGVICEVAHILPFHKCKNDMERYDPYNALYIDCSIHKILDDTNYISIIIDKKSYYIKINNDNIPDDNTLKFIQQRLNIAENDNKVRINHISSKSEYYIKQMY